MELKKGKVWFIGLLLYMAANGLKVLGLMFGPMTVLSSVFTTLLIFNLIVANKMLDEDITAICFKEECPSGEWQDARLPATVVRARHMLVMDNLVQLCTANQLSAEALHRAACSVCAFLLRATAHPHAEHGTRQPRRAAQPPPHRPAQASSQRLPRR